MDFASWWSCIGKGLRLQPVQQPGQRHSAYQSLASPVRPANILGAVNIVGPVNILGLLKHRSPANTFLLCQSFEFSEKNMLGSFLKDFKRMGQPKALPDVP